MKKFKYKEKALIPTLRVRDRSGGGFASQLELQQKVTDEKATALQSYLLAITNRQKSFFKEKIVKVMNKPTITRWFEPRFKVP